MLVLSFVLCFFPFLTLTLTLPNPLTFLSMQLLAGSTLFFLLTQTIMLCRNELRAGAAGIRRTHEPATANKDASSY